MGRNNTTRDPPDGASPAFDLRALEDPKAHPRLRQFVRGVLARLGAPGHELEDLVAEVVKDAALDRRLYDPAIASVETWLTSIAKHRLTDFFRRWRAKESRNVPEEEAPEAAEPVSPQLNPEQAAHAHRLLHALDGAVQGPARESFLLHAEGHSRAAIARETGLLPGAVKHRLERAGELRDQALAKVGEKRESGTEVRFGVLPLFLALLAHREELAAGSDKDPEGPSELHGIPVGRPPAPPRVLASRLLVAAALAFTTAVAMPVASGTAPVQDGAFLPLPGAPADARAAFAAPPSSGMPIEGTTANAETTPPASRGPVRPGADRAHPAQRPATKTTVQPADDTDVLLRLGAAAAWAGENDTASSLLDRHARQLPATEPVIRAGLARKVQSKAPPR